MEGVYKDLHIMKTKGIKLAKYAVYYGYIPLILFLGNTNIYKYVGYKTINYEEVFNKGRQ
jgi:hypothetical protein